MSPVLMIDAFARSIAEAEAAFEAEKCELLDTARCEPALQARRKYLKSIEAQLAAMHDQRRRMAGGVPDEAERIMVGLLSATR